MKAEKMQVAKITAKLRDAVPVCFMEDGKVAAEYKNIELPDEIKVLAMREFTFDIAMDGKITFRINLEGALPKPLPAPRELNHRKPKAAPVQPVAPKPVALAPVAPAMPAPKVELPKVDDILPPAAKPAGAPAKAAATPEIKKPEAVKAPEAPKAPVKTEAKPAAPAKAEKPTEKAAQPAKKPAPVAKPEVAKAPAKAEAKLTAPDKVEKTA